MSKVIMPLSGKVLAVGTVAAGVVGIGASKQFQQQRQFWFWNKQAPQKNRRYEVPLRYESELETLLVLPTPLLANFTGHHDPLSKSLTEQLEKIVLNETSKTVSLVDLEADQPEIKGLLNRYMVKSIPSVVAIRGGIPISQFTPSRSNNEPQEVDYEQLKQWVESIDE
ncbi:hypothetical protein AWJ20_4413 [Sugiyamaella lignohabitans]|uniref:Uncharacterized protein n=1 Tax=Sugiyamaella lignohabitans TaxID=796027 RepID=A0A167CEN9_9ASCO|nr:uncharacterized protein AWJ20_4413 [Sugiyamaella lignohabitans]ANB11593.1 hypothetical protein AWJ20_4413 [Sugiyamaella lignohabitans]